MMNKLCCYRYGTG